MNIRKLTRNPGWKRLFRVLTGIWYAVLFSIFVWFFVEQEQDLDEEFSPTAEQIQKEPWLADLKAYPSEPDQSETEYGRLVSPTIPEGIVLDVLDPVDVRLPDGHVVKNVPKATTKSELAELLNNYYRGYMSTTEMKNIRRIDYAIPFIPFILAPWVFLFAVRLFRYVIEGFSSEDSS